MIVKDILAFSQHVFLANSYMFRYSNHMISTVIEQKKVEETDVRTHGWIYGLVGGGGGVGGIRHHPHLCWVKSISYYF